MFKIEELQELKKHFENKGLCHRLSRGDDCRCPLCVLDDAIAAIKELEEELDLAKGRAENLIAERQYGEA